jgi:hypothetical protein
MHLFEKMGGIMKLKKIQRVACAGIVLGSLLHFTSLLSNAQTMQSASSGSDGRLTAGSDAQATVQRPTSSTDDADLPSAPEPNEEIALDSQSAQATQQTKPDPQNKPEEQKKPATEPSLSDLGFTPQQVQADAHLQEMLNKRTHMLKVHQTLGLWTTLPMVATLITGPYAKSKGKNGEVITEPTTANLDFHIALGGLTSAMYWTTAYYSIFAPKIPGVKPKGAAIRLHRALEWVHGPGMILTPILGIMAYNQENSGKKVSGAASLHGPVAYVTTIAYGASIIAVSWPIHWKFWEK